MLNMLNDIDALQKWCPFARFNILSKHFPSPGPMNRAGSDSGEDMNPRQARCIGSQCMAWRCGVPDPATYDAGYAPGYCGLAGKVTD